MRIRITAGGIFGNDGEIPIGKEFDVTTEPKGWAGRYDLIGASEGKTAVTNPEVDGLTVDELKALLTEKGVAIPEGAKKADLLALAKK